MSRVRTPDNINIASLKQKQAEQFDPMAPGSGTPWEDRGSHGTVGAFFKTCKMAITSPRQLFQLIRRPETTSDATAFVIGCAIIWGISAFIHGLIMMVLVLKNHPDYDVDRMWYVIYCGIAFVAAGGGTWLLFQLYNIVYAKLIAQEKSQALLPSPLLVNVSAYAMGPSILAIIPAVGPPLALLLIFIDLILAGSKRLRVRAAAAVIDALLAFLVVNAAGFAGYYVGNLVLHAVVGEVVVMPVIKPVHSGMP